MTENLKHKFEQLVADPPPPSEVPSQAVFARVRSVRRRRTAGVVTLAAAAVIAVAVAAGNLTDINSGPPVTNTPSAPTTIITAPPTTTPTSTPSTTPKKTVAGTTSSTNTTGAAHAPNTNTTNTPNTNTPNTKTPPPKSNTPVAPQLGVHVSLKPTFQGRLMTMKVTLTGTAMVPIGDIEGDPLRHVIGRTDTSFGDGITTGSDAGAVNCPNAKATASGPDSFVLLGDYQGGGAGPAKATHTYAKAGTYNFRYTIQYCGANDWVSVTRSTTVTVK
ncbi:hypothetical protein AB0L70_33280 [Kribbella sp. NPDC051952]|uniref:hypothetical protein n=1 Tax=Kribbella sp. NPDC051952 TaxID=3154851 RepID=UPI003422EF9E